MFDMSTWKKLLCQFEGYLKGAMCKNSPPVEFILNTNTGSNCWMLLTVAGISKLAQLAMQLTIWEPVSLQTIFERQDKKMFLPFCECFHLQALHNAPLMGFEF